MRNTLLFSGLLLLALSSSCATSTAPVDDSHLMLSPRIIQLHSLDTTVKLHTELSCGCAYYLRIEASGGDTDFIHVDGIIPELSSVDTAHRHSMDLSVVAHLPETFVAHKFTAWYAFWALKHNALAFRDTVWVSSD